MLFKTIVQGYTEIVSIYKLCSQNLGFDLFKMTSVSISILLGVMIKP